MSSEYVRTQIKQFLDEESEEKVVELDGEYEDVKDLIADAVDSDGDSLELQPEQPWLGLQFIGDDELPVSLAATNATGQYRETGSIIFHAVEPAALAVRKVLLTRLETLRTLFRGCRIGDIVIEGVTPPNFEDGATLQFEGGYMSGTFTAPYYRDINL